MPNASCRRLAVTAMVLMLHVSAWGATIAGTVRLKEKVQPPRRALEMSDECVAKNGGEPAYDRTLIVNDDYTLRNAFVYISKGLEGRTFEPPAEPAVLDERGCTYNPHVIGMLAGQHLKVINSDRMLDNLHSYPEINEPINITMLAFQPHVVVASGFTEPEVMIPLKCDVHRWQIAYIGVLPHPYFAVSGEDGRYALQDLAPGNYTVTAWHEQLGVQTYDITLTDGDATVDFAFSLEGAQD